MAKGKRGPKAPIVADARCTADYTKAAEAIGSVREERARGLVTKFAAAIGRGVSVASIQASIEDAQAAWKAAHPASDRDPLGWRPAWAGRILVVAAMMDANDSRSFSLTELFALANDLRLSKPSGAESLGIDGARKAVQETVAATDAFNKAEIAAAKAAGKPESGAVLRGAVASLRKETPVYKAPQRGAGRKSGPEKDGQAGAPVDIVAMLHDAIAAVEARCADGARIPESLSAAIGDALDTLMALQDRVTVG